MTREVVSIIYHYGQNNEIWGWFLALASLLTFFPEFLFVLKIGSIKHIVCSYVDAPPIKTTFTKINFKNYIHIFYLFFIKVTSFLPSSFTKTLTGKLDFSLVGLSLGVGVSIFYKKPASEIF